MMAKSGSKKNVDELLGEHDNPLKAEVHVIRDIIKGINPDIKEAWQWNAPSFSYKGNYMVTFNLWEKNRIHLVWHNPHIVNIKSTLLEGDYPTRRMSYFADMNDMEEKRAELVRVMGELIRLTNKE
jgi:uncharacterized protein YdhG (YjbR/CyaY superfamily)